MNLYKLLDDPKDQVCWLNVFNKRFLFMFYSYMYNIHNINLESIFIAFAVENTTYNGEEYMIISCHMLNYDTIGKKKKVNY